MQNIFPRPWREGIEGRGYLLTITLSPSLSRSGRGISNSSFHEKSRLELKKEITL
jgi:hypothetical protein